MKNIKVTFYSNVECEPTQITVIFRTEDTFDNFIREYQHFGGFRRFSYDVWEENCKENYPVLTDGYGDFSLVYNRLYPYASLKPYNPLA